MRLLRFFYLDIQNKKQSHDNYCNMYHDQEIESAISSHQIKERQDDRHGCDTYCSDYRGTAFYSGYKGKKTSESGTYPAGCSRGTCTCEDVPFDIK